MRGITLQRLGSLTVKQATSKEHSMHVFVFCLEEAEKPAAVCPADDCVLFLTCRKRARCKKELKEFIKHLKIGCINGE